MTETMFLLKDILIFIIHIYIFYVLFSCIIVYLIPIRIKNGLKNTLDSVEFYGDHQHEDERILLIEKPVCAYGIRINMIRAARRTLDITYHNLQVGDTTSAFLGELLKAADRGVHIRLLADAKIGMGDKAAKMGIRVLSAHPNIEIKGYNPLNLLKPWEFPVVLHDKFIITDDKYMLLGGRNIGDRYFDPNGYNRPVTNDRDVFITSSRKGADSITQVREYMDLLWESRYTKHMWKPFTHSKNHADQTNTLILKTRKIEDANPQYYERTLDDYINMTVPTSKITLVHNPINTSKKRPTLGYQLKRLVLTAEKNVTVQTPYATANKHLLTSMEEVSRKSSYTFLTNSKASTPNLIAYSTYSSQRKKFIRTGASLHELQSRDSIHAKSLYLDDRLSAVGSFNMDDRSFYVDTETMLIIDSPQFAEMLGSAMDYYLNKSLVVGKDNQYIADPTVKEIPVGKVRKAALLIISIPSRLLQFLI